MGPGRASVPVRDGGGRAPTRSKALLPKLREFASRLEAPRLALMLAIAATPLALQYGRLFRWGYVLALRDDRLIGLPMPYWAQLRLHRGEFPLMAPIYGGFPIYTDPEALAFYPVAFLAGFLPGLAGFQALTMFHLAAAVAGCLMLGRKLRFDLPSSAVIAVLWMSSGFFVTSGPGIPTILYALTWYPWLLWSLLRLDERFSAARLAAVAGLGALEILAGHPHMAFHFALLWLAWLAVGPLQQRRSTALASAGVAVTVLLLTAFAWMPWRMLGQQTVRGTPTEAFVRYLEMPLSWLPSLILPARTPAEYVYFGLSGILLALAGAWHRRRVALWLIALAAIYMALASINPLYRLIPHIPVWSQFRAPVRYVGIAFFLWSILAGYGLARLSSRRWLQLAALAVVAAELTLIRPAHKLPLLSFARYMQPSVAVEALRSRPPGAYYLYTLDRMRQQITGRPHETERMLHPRFRLMSDENLIWDIPGVQGYTPLSPLRQERFLERYGGSSEAGAINRPHRPGQLLELRRLGCRYVLSTVALPELARYPTSRLSDGMLLYDLGPAPLAIASGGGEIRALAAGSSWREVECLCSEPQKVIFTMGYWPELRALVNGAPQAVSAAGPNPAVTAPRGRSRVRIEYVPTSLYLGAWVSGASALIAIGCLAGLARRRRRFPRKAEPAVDQPSAAR
jgi:hypothetical protein